MGVFEKYGWAQSFDTYLHYYLLQPFDHPTLARLVPPFLHTPLNTLTAPMLRGVYHRHALALDALHVQPLDRKTLPTYTVHPSDPRVVLPTRDEAYVDWRLLQSPDREKYRMVSLREGDLHVVAKLCSEPVRHVDVLWISPLTKRDAIRETLAKMALWAMERDFAYLRAYYSIEELSDYLQRSLRPVVRHPRFAFYSRDDELFTALRDARWRWQLIDSDFEER
jgi:hypothetical protein